MLNVLRCLINIKVKTFSLTIEKYSNSFVFFVFYAKLYLFIDSELDIVELKLFNFVTPRNYFKNYKNLKILKKSQMKEVFL